MEDVMAKIAIVEAKIVVVEAEIADVKEKLKNNLLSENVVERLENKEIALLNEKTELRKEKNLLLEKVITFFFNWIILNIFTYLFYRDEFFHLCTFW